MRTARLKETVLHTEMFLEHQYNTGWAGWHSGQRQRVTDLTAHPASGLYGTEFWWQQIMSKTRRHPQISVLPDCLTLKSVHSDFFLRFYIVSPVFLFTPAGAVLHFHQTFYNNCSVLHKEKRESKIADAVNHLSANMFMCSFKRVKMSDTLFLKIILDKTKLMSDGLWWSALCWTRINRSGDFSPSILSEWETNTALCGYAVSNVD